MGITASTGPIVVFGQGIAPTDYNGQRAPSLFDQHLAMLDPRQLYTYTPGQSDANPVAGWFNGGEFVAYDGVLDTLQPDNIAASQSPGAGAITLVSADGAGIVVNKSVVNILTGQTVTGLLAVGDAGGRQSFGGVGTIQLWDPTKSPGRALRFVSGGSDSGITFTVNGYDVYGAPMTETITGAATGTATGKKAFKYIASITHTGSVAGTLTIGTTDIIGLPLRVDTFGYLRMMINQAIVTATTGFVAAVTTTATATTGDVRGTYALQVASNGTLRQLIFISVSPANVISQTGLLGVAQF
jgi:hypothetical protein